MTIITFTLGFASGLGTALIWLAAVYVANTVRPSTWSWAALQKGKIK